MFQYGYNFFKNRSILRRVGDDGSLDHTGCPFIHTQLQWMEAPEQDGDFYVNT